MISVSYTHLDVYKRQDKEGAVIQKHTGFPGVDTVKKELMKALEK